MKLSKALSDKKVSDYVDSRSKSYMDACDDLVLQFRKDWDKKNIVHSEKAIANSKHPKMICAFCDQLGCDVYIKRYGAYYHKKCIRYLIKRSIFASPKLIKDEFIKTKSDNNATSNEM